MLRSKIKFLKKIQKWWKRQKISNLYDPILNEPLSSFPRKYIFFHISDCGKHVHAFHGPTLLQHFIISGNTTNPLTRQQLNDIEIKRLYRKTDTDETEYKTKSYFDSILQINKSKQSIIDFTENSIGTFFMNVIGECKLHPAYSPRKALILLKIEYIPRINYYIKQLKDTADEEYFNIYVNDFYRRIDMEMECMQYDNDILTILKDHIIV